MTIAEAKAAVTSYATLQQYIGTKITDYNPDAEGTWRIFYYDAEGDFGPEGKLYLKRDYDSSNYTSLTSYSSYKPSDQGLEIMKAMNPMWRDYHPSAETNEIDLINEHCVAWLCDPENWMNYKTAQADYAIGSPSVEMYMKAYNVWKTGDRNAPNLICEVKDANGYKVGANGTYDNAGWHTNSNTIEAGPNNIFMESTSGDYDDWWLASPSTAHPTKLFLETRRDASLSDASYGAGGVVCPVVSL